MTVISISMTGGAGWLNMVVTGMFLGGVVDFGSMVLGMFTDAGLPIPFLGLQVILLRSSMQLSTADETCEHLGPSLELRISRGIHEVKTQ